MEESTPAKPAVLEVPATGYVRMRQLVEIVPLSRPTIWRWVKLRKFPMPVRIDNKVTVWRLEDIHAWMREKGRTKPDA
jgi:predicted DNA-binding transcriptional regulator AlpA